MSINAGALAITSTADAVDLVSLLFRRTRPADEVVAAIDKYSDLLPEGFDKVRADPAFLKGKLQTARFYATSVLPGAAALAHAVTEGSAAIVDLDDKALA